GGGSTQTTPGTTAVSIPPVGPIPPIVSNPPVPQTVTTPLPNTITQVQVTITQVPSTFSSLPPVTPTTVNTAQVITNTGATTSSSGFGLVGVDVVFVFPEIATGVGGVAAQLLPQIATGGGWSSTIAIANTSAVDRLVRADFFNSQGGPLLLPFGSS